jgi:hypothetical protein
VQISAIAAKSEVAGAALAAAGVSDFIFEKKGTGIY